MEGFYFADVADSQRTFLKKPITSVIADKDLNEETAEFLKKATKKTTESVHLIAHEPSLGLYRVREHAQRSIPAIVEKKKELKATSLRVEGVMYDLNYTCEVVSSLQQVTVFDKILRQINYSINLKKGVETIQLSKPEPLPEDITARISEKDIRSLQFSDLHQQIQQEIQDSEVKETNESKDEKRSSKVDADFEQEADSENVNDETSQNTEEKSGTKNEGDQKTSNAKAQSNLKKLTKNKISTTAKKTTAPTKKQNEADITFKSFS